MSALCDRPLTRDECTEFAENMACLRRAALWASAAGMLRHAVALAEHAARGAALLADHEEKFHSSGRRAAN